MAHYAYKAACYDIDRIKYQELVNRFEEEEGREHDGDSNYDGDNWYIMAMWINELRAKVAELESQASSASVPGWKLVPDVPTSTMVLAGEKALSEHDFLRMDSAYCAMLATAPTPPVSEDKDKIIAAANALENIASTSSSTRIRRVANDALTAIRARRK